MTTYRDALDSPVGTIVIEGSDDAITRVHMGVEPNGELARGTGAVANASDQMRAYFAGELTCFDVPLDAAGTAFQTTVWRALCDVPYGRTASYGEIARAIGRPTAARAIGHANARNPIGIIVPCHRIIGSSGTLTGYAGGLDRKATLLDLERAVLQQQTALETSASARTV